MNKDFDDLDTQKYLIELFKEAYDLLYNISGKTAHVTCVRNGKDKKPNFF